MDNLSAAAAALLNDLQRQRARTLHASEILPAAELLRAGKITVYDGLDGEIVADSEPDQVPPS